MWVASNQGITVIPTGSQPFEMTHMTRMDGLPTNDVNAIGFEGHSVWAATRNGIVRFPLPEEQDSSLKT